MTKHFDFANGNFFGTKSIYGKYLKALILMYAWKLWKMACFLIA